MITFFWVPGAPHPVPSHSPTRDNGQESKKVKPKSEKHAKERQKLSKILVQDSRSRWPFELATRANFYSLFYLLASFPPRHPLISHQDYSVFIISSRGDFPTYASRCAYLITTSPHILSHLPGVPGFFHFPRTRLSHLVSIGHLINQAKHKYPCVGISRYLILAYSSLVWSRRQHHPGPLVSRCTSRLSDFFCYDYPVYSYLIAPISITSLWITGSDTSH